MASTCRECGKKLGLLKRFRADLCDECAAKAAREAEERRTALVRAQQDYASRLNGQLLARLDDAREYERQLRAITPDASLDLRTTRTVKEAAVRRLLEDIFRDQRMTEEEEVRLATALAVLGVQATELARIYGDGFMAQFTVSRINGGRVAPLTAPSIRLKRGELAYFEYQAVLLKEVVQREYRGASSGMSFRVARGVYYHTGRTRGQSVVVGTTLQPSDQGTLSITSQRAVFTGGRTSLEFAYPKLLQIDTFADGVRLHTSSRKNPSLIRLPDGMGHVVTAAINWAAQDSLG